MKLLALLIALFLIAVGATAAVAPAGVLFAARYLITPVGLYFAAALRLGIGGTLFLAASESRTPQALRILGFIIFVGGLVTPFIGSERARAILEWYSAQGSTLMRLWACVAVLLGAFVAYTVGVRHRAAR